ncbi:putative permease, DMT superfamily [Hoeflea sp. IMCC20628]|uniref:EamA family transporter n=1 Tax=Hoeflea sp. IMCC20628 TaxID=1620421 RepID=UPI00063AE81A|nr:EamA family transporter [Hoeflea sp. IMCC20628]AKI01348.1 putative permease, DMT superfamily [Hoeflea sp. IMCC20628]
MLRTILITLLGPMLWGTTYAVFTETLPVSHPLLTGAVRALPAGLILLMLNPRIPPLAALMRHAVIGLSNIAVFFGLLFVAAARMPGGLAATLGAIQPLAVILISAWLIGRAPHPVQILAGIAGVVGVGLLVLSPDAHPDPIGVAAAIGGALSMAIGTVLIDRWGRMGTPLETTTWQLIFGGAILMPVALVFEGLPPAPGLTEILGYGWLIILGTAFAYFVWTRGIGKLGPSAAYLALASPIVATAIGAIALGEWFSPFQWAGMALVIGATAVGVSIKRRG